MAYSQTLAVINFIKGRTMKRLTMTLWTILTLLTSILVNAQDNLDQKLITTLDSMVLLDQRIQQDIYFNKEKKKEDSLFRQESEILKGDLLIAKKIFNKHGFPGIDLVGTKGAYNFWLLVQHCDSDTTFQKDVLVAMKKQVDRKNANAFNYAHLVDRVKINTGKKQVYGTQITFDKDLNAIPENFDNWDKVDEMRKALGIETLKEYLDRATKFNKERAKEKDEIKN